jgi:hypothetical protein
VRQFTDQIEVADGEIRIAGSRPVLTDSALDTGGKTAGVPSLVRGWWAQQDSNLRPAD